MTLLTDTSDILESLLTSDCSLNRVEGQFYSVLPSSVEGTRYDARAAAYDRIVGSALYNRLLWGVSLSCYDTFVREALGAGTGPFLDAGAGSAVFTATAYVEADRPLLLVDRSRGMLEAAKERLEKEAGGSVPTHITLLQADLERLPLRPESIDTVLSMGMLHLFEEVERHAQILLSTLIPGGTVFATSLVAERRIGRQYLRLLHAAGEVASPRSYDELCGQLSSGSGHDLTATREGSMAFLKLHKS